jgi:hypothetical protein
MRFICACDSVDELQRATNYILRQMRNQLREVTLNDKVKFNFALICRHAIEYVHYGV